MGEVISLATRRHERRSAARTRRHGRPAIVFAFDLSSPATYLGAERVDRLFTGVEWRPVLAATLWPGGAAAPGALAAEQAALQERARALRMPLVWPDNYRSAQPPTRAAMRVAAYAAELGRAAPFVLAAGRLAFCGGFDLDDPEILAEAAAAADLPLEACLRAAGDRDRDAALEAAGARLTAQGADRLPALRVGRLLFCGEERIAEAAAAARGAVLAFPQHAPAG